MLILTTALSSPYEMTYPGLLLLVLLWGLFGVLIIKIEE